MSNKLLVLFLLLSVSFATVHAQSSNNMPKIKHQKLVKKGNIDGVMAPGKDHSKAITGNETHTANAVSAHPQGNHAGTGLSGSVRSANITQIGTTIYDLQTNNSTFRRIVHHPDGDISAIWTFSENCPSTSSTDRGTGYNRYDAATGTWGEQPFERLENSTTAANPRTGFGGIGMTSGGRIFVVNHNGVNGLKFMYSDDDGTTWAANNFTSQSDECALWPRFAVSGNNIHVLASRQGSSATGFDDCDYSLNGVPRGLNYFRSTDGGNNWEGPFSIPGLDTLNFSQIGGDVYAMDARDNTVAFVTDGKFQPTLFKSTDNGDTWTSTVIQTTSNPLYYRVNPNDETLDVTTLLDVVATADNSYDIVLDSEGNAHVWYGRLSLSDDDPAAGYSYFPENTAIMYWNESLGTNNAQVIGETVRQDYDGDGAALYDWTNTSTPDAYFANIVSMPSAAVDANNNLYLVYSSVVETAFDANGNFLRGVFAIKSTDGGATWQGPVHVAGGDVTEAVYPMISRVVNDSIYFTFMSDELAGTSLQPTTPLNDCHTNDIMFASLAVSEIVSPTEASTTAPNVLVVSAPFGLEACPYDSSGIVNLTLDYPDGLMTDFTVENSTFNWANPTVGDHSYDLVFTDSDGLTGSATFDAITIFEDSEAPIIFGEPFEYVLDEATGLYAPVSFFDLVDTIDVIQGSTYTDLGAEAYDLVTIGSNVFDAGDLWGCNPLLSTDNPVNTDVPGTYYVTYSAIDGKGNEAEPVVRVVNVIAQDTEGPNVLVFDAEGTEYANGSEFELELDGNTVFTPFQFVGYDNVDGIIENVTVNGLDALFTALEAQDCDDVGAAYPITYTLTDAAGNTSTVTVTVVIVDAAAPLCIVFDVADLVLASEVAISPNPTRGNLNIAIGDVKGNIRINVYNMAGALMRSSNGNTGNSVAQLNIADLSSGMYYVSVIANSGMTTQKVVLNK
jgi:hypothetical protein